MSSGNKCHICKQQLGRNRKLQSGQLLKKAQLAALWLLDVSQSCYSASCATSRITAGPKKANKSHKLILYSLQGRQTFATAALTLVALAFAGQVECIF